MLTKCPDCGCVSTNTEECPNCGSPRARIPEKTTGKGGTLLSSEQEIAATEKTKGGRLFKILARCTKRR